MTIKVLMTAKALAQPGIELLGRAGCELTLMKDATTAELDQLVRDTPFDAIISRTLPLSRETIELAPALRVIARHGVGYNNVDLDAATDGGIPVLIADNANSQSVAEHTLALLLAVAKRIPVLDLKIRRGEWPRSSPGLQLAGKTAGIIAFGTIGQKVARLFQAVGLKVIVFDPHVSNRNGHDVEWADSLDQLLSTCNVVSLHCPLTAETEGLINVKRLTRMKPGSILINTARGGLVVQEALADAIASGHLAGAGFDTFADEPMRADHPFMVLQNIVMTPHVAGNTDAALDGVAISAVQNVLDALREGKINQRLLVNPAVLDRWVVKQGELAQ